MSKNIYYKYNPATDNFERHYPSLKFRLMQWGRTWALAAMLAALIFVVVFYFFDSPTEKNLRKENAELRAQYGILNKRLDNSVRVLGRLQERDDNFYRVMMQMDPISDSQRYSGLDNEGRYRELQRLNDANLVTQLSKGIDLMEHQLYAQMQSFDQIKEMLGKQKDKLVHIPAVLPIHLNDYTMSSGYGYRRDPIYGSVKFHEGLDFSAPTGTPVYATGNGTVSLAGRQAGYGNCVDLDHGYNYMSRYAHLSQVLVKEGERVKRGQLIGRVGATGKATAPHLHYEVRFRNEPQNPVNYYFMDLTPEQYAEMVQHAENAGHVMD